MPKSAQEITRRIDCAFNAMKESGMVVEYTLYLFESIEAYCGEDTLKRLQKELNDRFEEGRW